MWSTCIPTTERIKNFKLYYYVKKASYDAFFIKKSRVSKVEENENNIGHYSVIPTRILFNENLKPNVKLLYGAITLLANKEGYCYASNNYFWKKITNMSMRVWYKNKDKH